MYKTKYASKRRYPSKSGKYTSSSRTAGTKRYRPYRSPGGMSLVPTISGGAPIAFRRAYLDALFIVDNTDTLKCVDGNGADIQWLQLGSQVADAGTNLCQFGFGVNPGFDDLVNARDLSRLFSQYKYGVTEFKFTLESGDSAQAAGAAIPTQSPGCPHIFYAFDPTDDSPATSAENFLEYGNVKDHLLTNTQPLVVKYQLKPQIYMRDGAVNPVPFAIFDKNPWMTLVDALDSAVNLAPFYGLRVWVRNFGTSFTGCRMRVTAVQNFYVRYPR